MTLLSKTLRVQTYTHPEFVKLGDDEALYCFWHGRQFLLFTSFRDRDIAVMTDVSWAGEISSRTLARFGFRPVRGSSRRRGAEALVNMGKVMQEGWSGGIAADGPRGPIHRSKPGVIYLARRLGYPIVPVATSANRAWIIRQTWCRYLLPMPFSRCSIAVGGPLWVTDERGLTTEELDRVLSEWTAEADRMVGRPTGTEGDDNRSAETPSITEDEAHQT